MPPDDIHRDGQDCRHVWEIPTSHDQPALTGTCKVCGEQRDFCNQVVGSTRYITLPRDIMPSVKVRKDVVLSRCLWARHSRPQ